jgi:hypothetical protein
VVLAINVLRSICLLKLFSASSFVTQRSEKNWSSQRR